MKPFRRLRVRYTVVADAPDDSLLSPQVADAMVEFLSTRDGRTGVGPSPQSFVASNGVRIYMRYENEYNERALKP